jgi:hypothetical protein
VLLSAAAQKGVEKIQAGVAEIVPVKCVPDPLECQPFKAAN